MRDYAIISWYSPPLGLFCKAGEGDIHVFSHYFGSGNLLDTNNHAHHLLFKGININSKQLENNAIF